mgnify:CR=1 FL=1
MRITRLIRAASSATFILLAGFSGNTVFAAGLQISPISLELPADKKADGVWLRNTGTEVVHAQVRVYRWSQEQGEDVLTPDNGMVASPPMIQVAAGQQQLVRVVRVGATAAPAANERTYRLVIDELPVNKPGTRIGLDFVFRYSIPVFIAGTAPAKAVLNWSVQQSGKKAWLQVKNNGTSRAQLANIAFTPTQGKTTMVLEGLAGYALAGQYRRLELSSSPSLFANGGTFNSLINGVKTDTKVTSISKEP